MSGETASTGLPAPGTAPAADAGSSIPPECTRNLPPDKDAFATSLAWILTNPIPSLTILGAFTYLVFRVAFLIYYDRFGVTPEEVGLDYAGILTAQAAGGLAEILAVVGIALFVRVKLARNEGVILEGMIAVKELTEEQARLREEGTHSVLAQDFEKQYAFLKYSRHQSRHISRTATGYLVGLPLMFLTLVVADAVRAGDGARAPSITGPFQGRATHVVALWIDSPTTVSSGKAAPRPIAYSDLGANHLKASVPDFLLLGIRDGLVVLYDRQLGAVRLPRDKVVLLSTRMR